MGIEELKLVLQTLSGLADGAKEGFIWWLVIEGAMPKILLALFGAGVIGAAIFIARLVAQVSIAEKEAIKGMYDIAEICGVSIYGHWISDSDVRRVYEAVRNLKQGGK